MDGIRHDEGSLEKRNESAEDRLTRERNILGRQDVDSGTNQEPTQDQTTTSDEAPLIRSPMTRKQMEARIAEAENVPGVQ